MSGIGQSKEELAWDIFAENLFGYAEELESLRRRHETLEGANAAMVRRFCAFFDEDPDMVTYLLLTWHSQHQKLTPDMLSPMKVIIATIADGMKRGDVPHRDPVLVASMVNFQVICFGSPRASPRSAKNSDHG